jgi:hypothetical protein
MHLSGRLARVSSSPESLSFALCERDGILRLKGSRRSTSWPRLGFTLEIRFIGGTIEI